MRRRIVSYSVTVVLLIGVLLPVGTHLVFAHYENKYLAYHESLLFVIETLTTTGYGELAPFASLTATLWSGIIMAVGFLVLSVWLATLMTRWLSRQFQVLPPRSAPKDFKGHVIVYGAGDVGRFLAHHLQALGVPHLLIDDDRNALVPLLAGPLTVMEGGWDKVTTLQRAGIGSSRAIVATKHDLANAEVCLVARALHPNLPCICTVEQPESETTLMVAGATKTVSARRTLGERLAWLAMTPLSSQWSQLLSKLDDLAICQVPVLPGSALAGQSLRSLRIRERTGATILGRWLYGQFAPFLRHDLPLLAGQVIVAAGSRESLTQLQSLAGTRICPINAPVGSVLVLGGGDVGRAAASHLERAGISVRIMSLEFQTDAPGQTAGDATRPDDLRRAGVTEVDGCIIALSDDTAAIFATLLARQLNPALQILVRATSQESVSSLYLAGADHVLSVSEVVGITLEYLSLPPGVIPDALQTPTVREVPVPSRLVGQSIASGRIGSLAGCYLLAIQTAQGHFDISPTAHRRLKRGEVLFLFGTVKQLDVFERTFAEDPTSS